MKFKFTKEQAARLVVDAYNGVSSDKEYTAEERLQGSRELLKDLAQDYRANKHMIFAIMEQAMEQILPKRLEETVGRFAEVKQFKDNVAPKFLVRDGKITAYIVAEGSRVDRHRVTKRSVLVFTDVVQAKVYEELSLVRSGQTDFNELIDLATEAIQDKIYEMVFAALADAVTSVPAANKVSATEVDKQELNKIIQRVSAYGSPLILGTALGLSELPIQSNSGIAELESKGYVGNYLGAKCIKVENTVVDETNEEFVFPDRYLFVVPEGKDKIVKVALEGSPLVDDQKHTADWSMTFEMGQKAGVAVLQNHHIGVYDNTSLADE